jgi:acyl-CoA thioesterase-1
MAWLACGAAKPVAPLAGDEVGLAGEVLPLTDDEFSVRNREGDHRVRWDASTRFGRDVGVWSDLHLDSGEMEVDDVTTAEPGDRVRIPLGGTLKLILPTDGDDWRRAVATGRMTLRGPFELTIEEVAERLPTPDDPRLVGTLLHRETGNARFGLRVGERVLEVRPWMGDRLLRTKTPVFGRAGPEDVVPLRTFVQVRGEAREDAQGPYVAASRVSVRPLPDPALSLDPDLPRALLIGDSISVMYMDDLRHALDGRVSVTHPPENCGSSEKGRRRIEAWLGEGDRWDVIAFNFGHWDETGVPGRTREQRKARYQSNLESVIGSMRETQATLLWLTSTPNPRGYGAGDQDHGAGKNRLLNRWAAEVIARHPDVRVVDLFAVVESDPAYEDWWRGQNHHFPQPLGRPLGRAVARAVLDAVGLEEDPLAP